MGGSDSDSEGSETDEDCKEDAPKRRQVFFCSRTHSQLSQFVSELHRTSFAETLSVAAVAGRKVWCPTPRLTHTDTQAPKPTINYSH